MKYPKPWFCVCFLDDIDCNLPFPLFVKFLSFSCMSIFILFGCRVIDMAFLLFYFTLCILNVEFNFSTNNEQFLFDSLYSFWWQFLKNNTWKRWFYNLFYCYLSWNIKYLIINDIRLHTPLNQWQISTFLSHFIWFPVAFFELSTYWLN